ncbi:hypothetical protein CPB84DRAFT_1778829 [Gymnopilus junonius]|uniref:HNH nuclease domain-containing protein n=1 Tax=Gymnopilus junonius TaxID=109634 RepID=A0A9P5TMB0_GYMJU|nr:hypothetical protein CPB84DRAFT_1778829 [Gymnopilus junonius]
MPRCSCCSSSSSQSSSHLPITPPSTTNSENAAIKESDGLSDGLEKRVLDATSELYMDRCIIRNTRDSTCYSHVLSRATPEHIISRLEYSWGMTYGQLNVDSSFNILRLSTDLHRSFHHRLWVLIPEDSILRTYRKHKKRGPADNNFADLIPAGPYRYKFIVSRYLKGTSIKRWPESNEVLEGTAEDASPEQFEYPFTNFPTIVSHVHPRFVIYHAGYAFKKYVYDYFVSREDLRSSIENIFSIYRTWTKPIPADAIRSFVRFPKSLDPVDDRNDVYGENISERSGVTRAGRFNWGRKGPPDDSEALVGSLESGTLLVFDALVPHDTPKEDSISRWLAEVPAFSNEFDADPISNVPLN